MNAFCVKGDKMKLPTIKDIDPLCSALEGSDAVEHFYGKTLEEVEAMFADGLDYTGDLVFMGPKAFCFYLPAIVSFVKSDASRGDFTTLHGLVSMFEFKLMYQKSEIQPVLNDIKDLAEYVLDNWDKFIDYDMWKISMRKGKWLRLLKSLS